MFVRFLFFSLLCLLIRCDNYYDGYTDADSSQYDDGEQVATIKNETTLEEIIIIGNISYNLEDLPTYDVSININLPDTRSLKHLFILSTAFIDAVWKPFEEIEDFLFSLLTLQDAQQIDFVSTQWSQVAKFELGFIICLVVGFLFIVLFPIIGIFFCGCRCCDNCGGRLYQDMKDATSGWRIFHCLALMITTIMMMIGMIFVFLTNNWISEVVSEFGPATIQNIDHITNYADNIQLQATQVYDNYLLVENATLHELSIIGSVLGAPVQEELQGTFDPVFDELTQFGHQMTAILKSLEETSNDIVQLKNQTNIFETDLESLRENMLKDMDFKNCHINDPCLDLISVAKYVSLTADFSHMDTMTSEIDELQLILSEANFSQIVSAGQDAIDAIPQLIESLTLDDIASLTGENGPFRFIRDKFENIIDEISATLDLKTNESLPLLAAKNAIEDFSEQELPQYEFIRHSIGLTLGSLGAVVFSLNVIGICLGFCGYKREATPTNRGGASNIGGMCLMLSVFTSFLTGWILMLLTSVAFAIGGHAERYMCQTLQENSAGNFTGLQFLQQYFNTRNMLDISFGDFDLHIDVPFIMSECKNNTGMFTLLKLDEQFDLDEMLNVSAYKEKIATQFSQASSILNQTMDGFLIDAHIDKLKKMKDGKWKTIDFDARAGIASLPMETFADKIDSSRKGIEVNSSPMTELEKTTILKKLTKHSENVREMKKNQIESIETLLVKLEDEVEILKDKASTLDYLVDSLVESVVVLNETLSSGTPLRLAALTADYGETVTRHVSIFIQWLKRQLAENLGACQPIYGVYTNTMNIACSYIIDSLNAFWFSLGWTTMMFLPSIIFASKLYKWFRRMDQEEYFEEFVAYDYHQDKLTTPSAPSVH